MQDAPFQISTLWDDANKFPTLLVGWPGNSIPKPSTDSPEHCRLIVKNKIFGIVNNLEGIDTSPAIVRKEKTHFYRSFLRDHRKFFFALIGLLQNLQFLIAAAKFKILLGHHWTIKWLATSYFPLSNCEFFSVSISIYLLNIYLYDHIIRQRNRHRPSSSLSPLVSYYVFV